MKIVEANDVRRHSTGGKCGFPPFSSLTLALKAMVVLFKLESSEGWTMDYIAEAVKIRERAWADVMSSPAFRAFRAADNMVVDMGGESAMPNLGVKGGIGVVGAINPPLRVRPVVPQDRISQGDAAQIALGAANMPLQMATLMRDAVAQGAKVGGADPLANFRSQVSKDNRFYSFRHEREHYWWLTGVPLPEGWGEAADDLLDRAATSSPDSQEGGDDHAVNNTNLT